MTIIGTCHFVSLQKAIDYYRDGEILDVPAELERDVKRKIEEGEIYIGSPDIKEGEKLVKIDNGRRYAIES